MSDKECSNCHQIKPLSEFWLRHKNQPNSYSSTCKECDKERSAKYVRKSEIKSELKWVNGLECGVCGVRINDPHQKWGGMYLCDTHRPAGYPSCQSCLWQKCCRSRVKLGMWLLCERPVVEDIERLAINGVEEYKYRPEVIQK